jgi:hypothetical protein
MSTGGGKEQVKSLRTSLTCKTSQSFCTSFFFKILTHFILR